MERVPRSVNDKATSEPADRYKPIRIALFWEDLKGSTKYCTNACQTRPDLEGNTVTCSNADAPTFLKHRKGFASRTR